MKKLTSIFLFIIFSFVCKAQTAEEFKPYILKWEGISHVAVFRKNGEIVVGIGHNIFYESLRNYYYSDEEIDKIYLYDYAKALKTSREFIDNFDTLPLDAKFVCLSLEWTVGRHGFREFYDFRTAISNRNYQEAVNSLYYSKWSTQVSQSRLYEHIHRLKNLSKKS